MGTSSVASNKRLLFFWGSWCPVCKQMEPMLREHDWLIDVVWINVDRCPHHASEYQVMGTPTFCLVEYDKEIRRLVGAVSSNQLHEFIKGDR